MRQVVDSIISKALIIIMAVMVLNVLWQVFSRFLLGDPSSFTDELARFLLIWLGVLGAAYVSGRNQHVAIDVLPSKFNKRTQLRLMQFVRALIAIFCFLALVLGGSRLVYITHTLDQNSPVLNLPLSLVYLVIPVSGLIIMYYKITDIIQN